MLYRFIKKFKKVICMFIIVCFSVPIVAACGQNENNLKKSKENQVIGFGGDIEAYTTYSQANFMPMDKEMYHSYLVSNRDFILVVVPSETNEDGSKSPNRNSLMFQAAYNGVSPYADQLMEDGNFRLANQEYKLLIYLDFVCMFVYIIIIIILCTLYFIIIKLILLI